MLTKHSFTFALVIFAVILHQSQTQSSEETTTETTTTTDGSTTTQGSTTETTTTTDGLTTTSSITITIPTGNCERLTNCSLSDPPICGRQPTAICRRFRNICDLQDANCATQNNPLTTWTMVPMPSCSELAIGGTGLCSSGAPEPRPDCPPGPLVCPTGGNKVCAMSRNGQQCRMLVNACALRNLNCQSEPRNNWLQTSNSRCRNMCPGNEPERCTTNRYRFLLTIENQDDQ